MISEAIGASRRAASRGIRSLPIAVAVASTFSAPVLLIERGERLRGRIGEIMCRGVVLQRDHLANAVLRDFGGERVGIVARDYRDQLPPRLRASSRPALIAISVVFGKCPP